MDNAYLRGLFRFGEWESPHSWDSEEALGPTDWKLEEEEAMATAPTSPSQSVPQQQPVSSAAAGGTQAAVPKRAAPVLDPMSRITDSMDTVAASMKLLTLELGNTQAELRSLANSHETLAATVQQHEAAIQAKGIMIQAADTQPVGDPTAWQFSASAHSGSSAVTGQQVQEIVTEALQTKVAPALGFIMKKTEERFGKNEEMLRAHEAQLRSLNLRVAWTEKESYYAQIEVAKRQLAVRGVPKEMSDKDLILTVEQACITAKVDPTMVDLSIPKVQNEKGEIERGPVQFVSFLTAGARRDFMAYNKENDKEGTKLKPWTWVQIERSREEEVTDEEDPSGRAKKKSTLKWNENHPQENPNLRAKIKCTPGITQFERRLSAPMHGLMHAYRECFPRYKTETLAPKWKTLILTDQRGAWLGQLEYTRTVRPFATTGGSTADWKCDIQLPEEHYEKLMLAWKGYWYTQLRSQVQYTDAESQAIKNLAEDTAEDYRTAQRISKLVQRQIPQWSDGAEEGIKEWVVRFKWEYPWDVTFTAIAPGDPKRQHFEEPLTVTELMESMAADKVDMEVEEGTTLETLATGGSAGAKRKKYTEEEVLKIEVTDAEFQEWTKNTPFRIGEGGEEGAEWGGKWYTKAQWREHYTKHKQKKARAETEAIPQADPMSTAASSASGAAAEAAQNSHRGEGALPRTSRERGSPYAKNSPPLPPAGRLGSGLQRGSQNE